MHLTFAFITNDGVLSYFSSKHERKSDAWNGLGTGLERSSSLMSSIHSFLFGDAPCHVRKLRCRPIEPGRSRGFDGSLVFQWWDGSIQGMLSTRLLGVRCDPGKEGVTGRGTVQPRIAGVKIQTQLERMIPPDDGHVIRIPRFASRVRYIPWIRQQDQAIIRPTWPSWNIRRPQRRGLD